MPTVLVTGANRGLGLEFVRQYIKLGWDVIACCRDPEARTLRGLDKTRLRVEKLDVADHEGVDRLAQALDDFSIDLLVNNAGTTGPKGAPECIEYTGFDNMDYDIWRQILEVNVLGAFKVATAFRPHLASADQGILLNMSSDVGSIENSSGKLYSYRTSKAALNIITKGFAVEWPEIISVAMAPGWCRTDLGGGDIADIDPADSVQEQIATIDRLTATDSGRFIDRFGADVPW